MKSQRMLLMEFICLNSLEKRLGGSSRYWSRWFMQKQNWSYFERCSLKGRIFCQCFQESYWRFPPCPLTMNLRILEAVLCPEVPRAIRCSGQWAPINLQMNRSTMSDWLAPSLKLLRICLSYCSPMTSYNLRMFSFSSLQAQNTSILFIFSLYSPALSFKQLKSTCTTSRDWNNRCFWNFFCSSHSIFPKHTEFIPPDKQTTILSFSVILILFWRFTLHLYSTFLREQALHIDSPLYRIDPGLVLHLKHILVLGACFQMLASLGFYYFLGSGALQHRVTWTSHSQSVAFYYFLRDSISESIGKTKGSSPKPQGRSYIKEYNESLQYQRLINIYYLIIPISSSNMIYYQFTLQQLQRYCPKSIPSSLSSGYPHILIICP